jgi:hypothetical protein
VYYQTTDILVCLSLIRVFFIIEAAFAYLPFNMLYGKKTCHESGVEPNFYFQLRAAFKKYPYSTFNSLAILCVLVDAYVIRVWERPYYELLFDPPYYTFSSLSNSIWYTIISMTSVGYGEMVASTHMGRVWAVFTIVNGAFLLALLVGLVLGWIELEDYKKDTINKIQESRLAVKAVRRALEYNIARQQRKRHLLG